MSENAEILNYIKRAFELKSQDCYKQSIEMFYKALAIEPDNTEIIYQLGELYKLLHNYPRAMQYTEQVLEKVPNHIPSLKLLKEIYVKQTEFIQAKETAEKIYALEPTADNLISVINVYGKLYMVEDLEKYLDKITSDDKCLYEYADVLYRNKKISDAEKIIKEALKSNPDNEDFLILAGKIAFDNNEFDKAKEIFERFGKNSQNPEILNYQGLFAMDETRFIDAIKDFSKAASIDTKNPIYFYNLANAYFLNGWYEEAVTAYQNAILLAPDNLDYRYSLAYLYHKYKNYDKSQKEIDFILERDGKYYPARVIKALLLYESKNYLEAEKLLLSNVDEGVSDDFTLTSLAKIELELGKFDKAEKHINEVLSRNPDNMGYLCELGDICIKEKKYKEAVEIADKVTDENENYIYGYILGAKAAFLDKDLQTAKSFAQSAISTDINCAEGYYYLAQVRAEEKDYEEAVECMKRAITYDVTNAEYYAKMAEIYKSAGDIKTAFNYVKEAESISDSEEYKILYKEYAALNRKNLPCK